jgi:serine/threonine protein phosphatase 1
MNPECKRSAPVKHASKSRQHILVHILAIGDTHGCLSSLLHLEQLVPVRPDDLVVNLGDYVNRGPRSKEVIDWLIAREATGQLVPLRGNHVTILLQARQVVHELQCLLDVDGAATLQSYASPQSPGRLADIPREHWEFVERTRSHHETATHAVVVLQ